MRSVVSQGFGGVDVLHVVDIPRPEPAAGQVLVDVTAAAVNPVDLQTRTGMLSEAGLHSWTTVGLGWDVSGTIAAVGEGIRRLTVGQQVIGMSDRLDAGSKTHADAVVLDEDAVAAVPATLDPIHASTLPLAGLTALQALDAAGLERGSSLLVTGGAGAVGSLVIELALLRGLRVVATARPVHESQVRRLGAEFVPTSDALAEQVRALIPGGVDGAIDAASLGVASLNAVRNRGAHVSLIVLKRPPALRGIRSVSVAVRADWEQLTFLGALAAAGALTKPTNVVVPLEQIARAHQLLADRATPGRLVVEPRRR